MNITCNRAALAAALDTAKAVADTKSPQAIVACVQLVAKGAKLVATATDFNLTAITTVPCAGDAGTAIVSCGELHAVVHRLAGDEVRLKLDGTVLIVSSRKATQKISSQPASSWNKVRAAPGEWQTVPGDVIAGALRLALPAICHDETRFHLNGIYVDANGKRIRAVSTDGHRMHASDKAAPWLLTNPIIIPAKAAKAIIRLVGDAGDVQVENEGEYLHVLAGVSSLSVKLISAVWPPYQQVIPDHDACATVDRSTLFDAVNRAALATSEAGGIRLTFDKDALSVASHNKEGRASDEVLEVECARTSPMTIGVNPKFLMEALTALGGDAVTFRLGKPLEPLMLHRADAAADKAAGDAAVVMPMQV